MLRIAICDDEKHICNQIKNFIENYQNKNQITISVDVFFNGEDLHEKLVTCQFYDLIFLDIEMYQINGIDIGTYIRNEQENEITQIVFVSSKQNYAMELFAVRPLDFIIKPVDYERISYCIDYLQKRKQQQKAIFSYQVSNITKIVSLDDILYFQSNSRKIVITHTKGSDEFYGKLDEIEEQLPKEIFLRIHKSTLINYYWISLIQNLNVTMKDHTTLQISNPRRKEIYKRMNEIRKKGIISWN